MSKSLEEFNALSVEEAQDQAMAFCGCLAWAVEVAENRPYADVEALQAVAASAWSGCDVEHKLEAFAAHPMIGDVDLLRQKFANTARAEQGQVLLATDEVLEELARLNKVYFERHGFIFIIFASGKSAPEMLSALQARVCNKTSEEIGHASEEQAKITQLRIKQAFD